MNKRLRFPILTNWFTGKLLSNTLRPIRKCSQTNSKGKSRNMTGVVVAKSEIRNRRSFPFPSSRAVLGK